jgi:hypothetical protein
MKKIILAILLVSLLMFGCTGVPGSENTPAFGPGGLVQPDTNKTIPAMNGNDDLPPPLPE